VTNLNALIDSVGPLTRRPDEARAAVLHVLRRVDGGRLTAGQAREVLEVLGLVPTQPPQPIPARPPQTLSEGKTGQEQATPPAQQTPNPADPA
jgi:hypothetical protein